MAGKVPKRKKGIYTMATVVPVMNEDYDWEGILQGEELPKLINPTYRDYISSSNNWLYNI